MATIVRMPEVLANATEAALQSWLVELGAEIELGQPLAELETEKAMVEYNAEMSGTVVRMLVNPGDSVDVGAPIAVIAAAGESEADIESVLDAAGLGSVASGSAAVQGEEAVVDADADADAAAGAVGSVAESSADTTGTSAAVGEEANRGRQFMSPLVRRLARERGLDLSGIAGSGPEGRIVRRDIENLDSADTMGDAGARATADSSASATVPALAESSAEAAIGSTEPDRGAVSVGAESSATPAADRETPPVPATADALATSAGPAATSTQPAASRPVSTPLSTTDEGGYELIPHSGMRRAIARRLSESKQTVPHFYLKADCRVDALIELRRTVNESASRKLSLNDFVVKAVASAFADVPEANAIWTDDGTKRFEHVDIAVAVATPGGLLTPVIRSVDTQSITGVSKTIAGLAERARGGRLRQHELEGGSFSVSNLGMYGVSEFSAIINPPQSAILAVGVARQAPVVSDGVLAIGTVMTVTLSADHRVLDGALAAQWLAAFVARIEAPLSILL